MTILFGILNWGLGHATRSIPLIRALQERGHRVIIASDGPSLDLLRQGFPNGEFVVLPGFGVRYTRHANLLIPVLVLQIPRFFFRIFREYAMTERIVRLYAVDRIISDNRYGCFSRRVPTFFITHQLRFSLPKGIERFAFLSEWFNRFFFRFFREIWVPDVPGEPNLSGGLSHAGRIAMHPKVRYIGPLSSLEDDQDRPEPVDWLMIVSGPEPQRSLFEAALLRQAPSLPGRKVVVLGRPEGPDTPLFFTPDLVVYAHLDRKRMARLMRGAEWVVCRSGYTTIMELSVFKKKAILIPTPGQTEQQYLARHMFDTGLFYAIFEKAWDLQRALPGAEAFYRRPRRFPPFVLAYDSVLHRIEGEK